MSDERGPAPATKKAKGPSKSRPSEPLPPDCPYQYLTDIEAFTAAAEELEALRREMEAEEKADTVEALQPACLLSIVLTRMDA